MNVSFVFGMEQKVGRFSIQSTKTFFGSLTSKVIHINVGLKI